MPLVRQRNRGPRGVNVVCRISPLRAAFLRWRNAQQRPKVPLRPPQRPLLPKPSREDVVEQATQIDAVEALALQTKGTGCLVPCNHSTSSLDATAQQLRPARDDSGWYFFVANVKSACGCSKSFGNFNAIYSPTAHHSVISMRLVKSLGLPILPALPPAKSMPLLTPVGLVKPKFFALITIKSSIGVPETTMIMYVQDLALDASNIDCFLGRSIIQQVQMKHPGVSLDSVFPRTLRRDLPYDPSLAGEREYLYRSK